MTSPTKNGGVILWQQSDDLVGEPAIMISPYVDCIELIQDGRHITLNYESIKEFCKALKEIQRP